MDKFALAVVVRELETACIAHGDIGVEGEAHGLDARGLTAVPVVAHDQSQLVPTNECVAVGVCIERGRCHHR